MDRPFVYVNMAMTADGKITSAVRDYPRFTSDLDRLTMDRLRAEADAIVVGAGTIRADNPRLDVRDPGMRGLRKRLGKPPGLVRVLVTRGGAIDPRSRFFDEEEGGTRIIATAGQADDAALARIAGRAEIWKFEGKQVEPGQLIKRLARSGVERLLLEGGGELNWAFISDDLIDELYVTIAPALLGGREAPTLLEGQGFTMKELKRLRLLEMRREGDEIFCRYGVRRP